MNDWSNSNKYKIDILLLIDAVTVLSYTYCFMLLFFL
uniref:Uncharacterized protein n=1 Tax=Anguilla anguilla TaxID=7936 RepID=A0A0E9R6N2_ANGAN